MNLDEIKGRLMKMKALANAGVGGERDPHYHEIASRRVNDAKPLSQTTQTELPL